MGLLIAAEVGLIFWIVAWSVGVKSIDAFLVTALIFLLTVAARAIAPHLPGNRADSADPPGTPR